MLLKWDMFYYNAIIILLYLCNIIVFVVGVAFTNIMINDRHA